MRTLAVLAALVLGAPARAAEPEVVLVPPPAPLKWQELKGPPCTQLAVKAPPGSEWLRLDEGCELTQLAQDGVAIFSAAKPGRYRIVALPAAGRPLPVVMVIGDAPPPKPPEPPPTDPLAAKLKLVFDADPAALATRREQAKDLAALYRQAAKLAEDESVATSGALLQRVKDASATLVGPTALREVRRVVAQELAAVLPTDDVLSAEQRRATAALFLRLAAILDALGGG